MSFNYVKEKM